MVESFGECCAFFADGDIRPLTPNSNFYFQCNRRPHFENKAKEREKNTHTPRLANTMVQKYKTRDSNKIIALISKSIQQNVCTANVEIETERQNS